MRKVANQKKNTKKNNTKKISILWHQTNLWENNNFISASINQTELLDHTQQARGWGSTPWRCDAAGATATGGRPWAVGKEGTHVGQNCGSPLPVRPPKGFWRGPGIRARSQAVLIWKLGRKIQSLTRPEAQGTDSQAVPIRICCLHELEQHPLPKLWQWYKHGRPQKTLSTAQASGDQQLAICQRSINLNPVEHPRSNTEF